MGVPAFFRWLSRKYPSVIVPCVEQKAVDVNGTRIPTNSCEPNPNGVEFDNLYLDMNGIIHPCTHPEDKPAPKNEDEMMIAIFECIDRLFNIVRPRKLLYMAIDGVAPRAKMNQQRSRRFRASKETVEKVNEIKRIRAELLLKGCELPPEKPKEEHFDSNCITPGTPFMARLSECLHYYIHDRLNNDPGWRGIKVILSDANVPGEGEHKIMDYIRKQRAQPDHDPNTQHVLCGADADLIMLGLATHEPNFTIIREEFKPNKPRPCDICGQLGHEMKDCIGGVRSEYGEEPLQTISAETDFIFVRLCVLREYLEKELSMPNLPFKYEFERVLDDWVFMCFFVGNDFLPHLPSLEIREGAIDRLIRLYKDCVYKTGGYLTDSGDVNLERVQMIMLELGKAEDEIFKTRQQKELQFKAREKAKKRRSDGYSDYRPNWNLIKNTQFAPRAIGQEQAVQNARQEAYNIRRAGMHTQSNSQVDSGLQGTDAKTALQSMFRPAGQDDSQSNVASNKRKFDQVDNDSDDDQAHDEVRLWEDGFKDRYYESKFDVAPKQLEFRYSVALHYVRGLCWVLRYYYQGCASWKWYYPYHYAPFASDFCNIAGLSTEFEADTKPFNPLEQLMGVFPAASSKHVPEPFAKLMSDPASPIIDFYPDDFKIDLNGKKFAWQGVALLPFVDEERLFKALKPYYDQLSEAEKKRNVRGDDRLYVSVKNEGYDMLSNLYKAKIDENAENAISIEGMRGTVLLSDDRVEIDGSLTSPVKGLPPVHGNIVVCVRFRDPKYGKGFVFPARKLKGAKDPPRVLKPEDLSPQENRQWRSQIGMAPATQRASLDLPGHRMLGHYAPREKGPYGSVPPPSGLDNRRSSYPSYSGQRYQDNRGYQGQRQDNRDYYQRQSDYRGYQGTNQQSNYNQGGPYGPGSSYSQNNYNQNYNQRSYNQQDRNRPPGPYRDRYVSNNRYNYGR
ncbi:5'-3' exoribonuclease 2 homolog isoform X2 [Cylas formicarius]|uniref:5'-3' exoribonuclease 2 homolog isoform X2 n=1 Tax=Cylas formicarius TaxID=197179 RepID=UPI002958A159|nr:5'-3' exoribonuclease 2 homolog isoform X2 [Cylas formicarius]